MKWHQVQCQDSLSGYRRSLGIVTGPWEGGALTPESSVCFPTQCGLFRGRNVQFGRDSQSEKGGFCFLLPQTNLSLLWSQQSFLVQHNTAFSECVSYVNAASEKFPSALHFNSAFKTCKTETQRKTPWKYFGFHLFSIFTSGSCIFF